MASYEKIVKYVVENFHDALRPLGKIVENQETIIRQNAELQAVINKIYHRNVIKADDVLTEREDSED